MTLDQNRTRFPTKNPCVGYELANYARPRFVASRNWIRDSALGKLPQGGVRDAGENCRDAGPA